MPESLHVAMDAIFFISGTPEIVQIAVTHFALSSLHSVWLKNKFCSDTFHISNNNYVHFFLIEWYCHNFPFFNYISFSIKSVSTQRTLLKFYLEHSNSFHSMSRNASKHCSFFFRTWCFVILSIWLDIPCVCFRKAPCAAPLVIHFKAQECSGPR